MIDFLNMLTSDSGKILTDGVKYILKPLVILIVCKLLIDAAMKLLDRMLTRSKLEKSIQTFSRSAVRVSLWCLTAIFVADALGVNTASLVAILSVVSLALSLAFQGIMNNVFSGIVTIISKPFSVGDVVDIGGNTGTVKEVSIMRTTLLTFDNKVLLIPNSDVAAAQITNYSTEPFRRVDMTFTVSYDAKTEDVKAAVLRVIGADGRIQNGSGRDPFIRLSEFNANDIEYTLRVWVKNADYWNVYYDLKEKIRDEFDRSGIEFSYPHVVVHTA